MWNILIYGNIWWIWGSCGEISENEVLKFMQSFGKWHYAESRWWYIYYFWGYFEIKRFLHPPPFREGVQGASKDAAKNISTCTKMAISAKTVKNQALKKKIWNFCGHKGMQCHKGPQKRHKEKQRANGGGGGQKPPWLRKDEEEEEDGQGGPVRGPAQAVRPANTPRGTCNPAQSSQGWAFHRRPLLGVHPRPLNSPNRARKRPKQSQSGLNGQRGDKEWLRMDRK